MAASRLGRARLDELGRDLPADVDRERAAIDEAAARRRVDGGGRGSLADLDLLERARPVGDRRDQQARVRVQRIREHLRDRPLLDDLAGVHDEDVVGDVARARQVVRDIEERDAAYP